MSDQNPASTERAILNEITAPFESLPDDPLPIAADIDFPVALRGYDRLAVDAYVRKTTQLVAELQATRSPDAAIRRALDRVGEQISGILQRAQESAEQISTESHSEAEATLQAARGEAAQITAEARNKLQELDIETDRIWAERLRIVEDARALARQLLALADSAAERFPPDEDPQPQEEETSLAGASGEEEDPEGVIEPEDGGLAQGEPLADGDLGPHGDAPGGGPEEGDVTAIMPPVRPSDGDLQ